MGTFLRLVNGVQRSYSEASSPAVYDQSLNVVSGSPGAGEILGPILAGTSVSLPAAQTYTSSELQILLNGIRLEAVLDFTYVGSPPRTQVQFTFDLAVNDRIRFRIG